MGLLPRPDPGAHAGWSGRWESITFHVLEAKGVICVVQGPQTSSLKELPTLSPVTPLPPRPVPGLLPISSGDDKAGRSGLGQPGGLERSQLSAQSPSRAPGGPGAVGSQACPLLWGRAGSGEWGLHGQLSVAPCPFPSLGHADQLSLPQPPQSPDVVRWSASSRTSP